VHRQHAHDSDHGSRPNVQSFPLAAHSLLRNEPKYFVALYLPARLLPWWHIIRPCTTDRYQRNGTLSQASKRLGTPEG